MYGWNFRRVTDGTTTVLAEVYYDDDGTPDGWCEIDRTDFFRALVEASRQSVLAYTEEGALV